MKKIVSIIALALVAMASYGETYDIAKDQSWKDQIQADVVVEKSVFAFLVLTPPTVYGISKLNGDADQKAASNLAVAVAVEVFVYLIFEAQDIITENLQE